MQKVRSRLVKNKNKTVNIVGRRTIKESVRIFHTDFPLSLQRDLFRNSRAHELKGDKFME